MVEAWVTMPESDPRRELMEDATQMVALANSRPPESLEELQVRIDLDGVDGVTLAAWRDVYASDTRDPNPYHHHVDLCLDALRHLFACWNCGRPAVDTNLDDLPVCATCKEKN